VKRQGKRIARNSTLSYRNPHRRNLRAAGRIALTRFIFLVAIDLAAVPYPVVGNSLGRPKGRAGNSPASGGERLLNDKATLAKPREGTKHGRYLKAFLVAGENVRDFGGEDSILAR